MLSTCGPTTRPVSGDRPPALAPMSRRRLTRSRGSSRHRNVRPAAHRTGSASGSCYDAVVAPPVRRISVRAAHARSCRWKPSSCPRSCSRVRDAPGRRDAERVAAPITYTDLWSEAWPEMIVREARHQRRRRASQTLRADASATSRKANAAVAPRRQGVSGRGRAAAARLARRRARPRQRRTLERTGLAFSSTEVSPLRPARPCPARWCARGTRPRPRVTVRQHPQRRQPGSAQLVELLAQGACPAPPRPPRTSRWPASRPSPRRRPAAWSAGAAGRRRRGRWPGCPRAARRTGRPPPRHPGHGVGRP